ncbi:MAG TPA: TolC family protein [Polyangia bacterium]|nr:TolC family protein [Polyangia bacterium]
MSNRNLKKLAPVLVIAGSMVAAVPAFALQPLAEFLDGARRVNVDNREAALTAVERDQEALMSLGPVLPSLNVRGVYTRNQYQSGVGTIVIVPNDQWDAFIQAGVPIVDLAAWTRARAARASARASRHQIRATLLDVEKQVARSYYQLIGAVALRQSGDRTLAAAQANHDLTVERRRAGVATELDVERSAAEVERARQTIADADLSAQLARRALSTLTGLAASEEVVASADDLHDEPPLEEWEGTPPGRLPALVAASEQRRSAELGAQAATLAFAPTLGGSATEHFTNAAGFIGHDSSYTLALTLTWHFDLALLGDMRAQAAAADAARVRQERVRLQVGDQIHESWQRVRSGIVVCRAARAQARAAWTAADHARGRYASGVGTQLEVIEAQRDAASADVARIQADADLSYARAALRLSAGQVLDRERDPR